MYNNETDFQYFLLKHNNLNIEKYSKVVEGSKRIKYNNKTVNMLMLSY